MGFAPSDMQVTSTAFASGEAIPARHTGEAENLSPPLAWSGAPEGTQSFALFCHDPDAPLINRGTYGFVHWVLYDIPASVDRLPEGVKEHTPGSNDMGGTGYGGPMPPEGHGRHHYFFWLLALDRNLDLGPDLALWDLLPQVEPHVLGMSRLVGTYER